MSQRSTTAQVADGLSGDRDYPHGDIKVLATMGEYHPATGYMISRTMNLAASQAEAIERALANHPGDAEAAAHDAHALDVTGLETHKADWKGSFLVVDQRTLDELGGRADAALVRTRMNNIE